MARIIIKIEEGLVSSVFTDIKEKLDISVLDEDLIDDEWEEEMQKLRDEASTLIEHHR